MLRGTDDPNESIPKEAAYFEGAGLMDHIRSSQKRKKGLQSHQIKQQMTTDTPTTSISVPIRTVLWAKVMVDDLVNFQLRLGSTNTLMAAIRGTGGKTSGTDGARKDELRHSKKQP